MLPLARTCSLTIIVITASLLSGCGHYYYSTLSKQEECANLRHEMVQTRTIPRQSDTFAINAHYRWMQRKYQELGCTSYLHSLLFHGS